VPCWDDSLPPPLCDGGGVKAVSSSSHVSLNTHCDTHAAADAQRGKAATDVTAYHLVEQRGQHPGSRGTDGMAERDGATIDVDAGDIPAELAGTHETRGFYR
jgi:hypothetical protein